MIKKKCEKIFTAPDGGAISELVLKTLKEISYNDSVSS
ncbi:hypothetical protein LEP1GSC125_1385 [Leptospira mayottensis 200901122]|uniref:Uncharacterized protein n=1 Tax=Leptospira mayottensis 200901122 TaxID=1193010 RepID=A0AA87MQV6_9LEPT|nr:hypothetical protein LEP1GSC125_1385 [Leptospira mayottensis 200901122]